MEKNKTDPALEQPQEEQHVTPAAADTTETAPTPADEEHTHGNYLFAVKVLAVLAGIILLLIILKASGVPIAIKDWFSDCISYIPFIR